MAPVQSSKGALSLTAYRGDAKTLLAFNLSTKASRTRLAGFTIEIEPPGVESYYLQNNLRFKNPADHAQVATEPANSSINAPFHKFRWVHHPGLVHQGLTPKLGLYTYTVTPRYFDGDESLKPLDPSLSASVKIKVGGFAEGKVAVGFTRGFVQSQAFVRHFGRSAKIKPNGAGLIFDTSQKSGENAEGETFTFEDQYKWLGFTARQIIFDLLDEVFNDGSLTIDVFAYDLNEPGVVERLLEIGKVKRARVILDNAALHHSAAKPKPEDEFEKLFAAKAGKGAIKRGKFGRYAHDKVFVVSDANGPRKVLTGSTNFSVTGLYVNSNHVLVFDDRKVAKLYAKLFQDVWDGDVKTAAFKSNALASDTFKFNTASVPDTRITFSPHDEAVARSILGGLVDRIDKEGAETDVKGSVLFAVMGLEGGEDNPVYDALNSVHEQEDIFSYGISDSPKGIALHEVGKKTGVLVTGKPASSVLPPPFSQVPGIGLGHQVHHKFVVCGFNGKDPVVYCGSSNLALAGEQVNGDNLLEIHDEEIATAFAIEALELVDHFEFLDRSAVGPKSKAAKKKKPAIKAEVAASAGWFLGTTDKWVEKFYDPNDLHFVDRELFAD